MEFNYECATVEGVGIKTSILLGVTFLTTLVMLALILNFGYLPIFMYFIAIILTTILQIIINIRPMKAKSLAIPYAISEGLVIGCLCGLLEDVYKRQMIPNLIVFLLGYGLIINC